MVLDRPVDELEAKVFLTPNLFSIPSKTMQSNQPRIGRGDVLKIYTDGASRKNPGHSSCAYIFVNKDNNIIFENSYYLGELTNNKAEYKALNKALYEASTYTRWEVEVYSDSQLLVNQMSGVWRIKSPELKELFNSAKQMESQYSKVSYFHVPRENRFIMRADQLCNKCLDENVKR